MEELAASCNQTNNMFIALVPQIEKFSDVARSKNYSFINQDILQNIKAAVYNGQKLNKLSI